MTWSLQWLMFTTCLEAPVVSGAALLGLCTRTHTGHTGLCSVGHLYSLAQRAASVKVNVISIYPVCLLCNCARVNTMKARVCVHLCVCVCVCVCLRVSERVHVFKSNISQYTNPSR